MSSVTILTEDNEIVIIPRHRASLQLVGVPVSYSEADKQPGNTAAFPAHTKFFADGSTVTSGTTDFDRTDHVAVIDHATGLMWSVKSIGDSDGDPMSHADCEKACSELRLLGHADWRLPTRAELAALVDDARHEPAIDTGLFPGVLPRWHWTSTAAAWSSASAWGVNFYDGGVYDLHRNGGGFALAVRRAGQ